MHPFEAIAIIVLLMLGTVQLASAFGAARLPLRLRSLPVRSPQDLQEGSCQLQGDFKSVDAAPGTLDGNPAFIFETRLVAPVRWDSLNVKTWPHVVVGDGSQSCKIDLDGVILLDERQRITLEDTEFQARFPALWNLCPPYVHKSLHFQVEQRFIPLSRPVFVAGELTRLRVTEQGYRGGVGEQWVLASGQGMPLIVSARTRAEVVRHLLAPAVLHGAVALLSFLLVGVILGVDRWIAAAAAP
ncbi:MAG: hypothetical protein HY898_09575 [Deltaproteobacteria bacterium]|nr:hypothetical protein [Deltaproteobacteria bacterium]